MDDLPLIPVIYMHRMIDMLHEEHVDTDQILRDCGINPTLMTRPDTLLTGLPASPLPATPTLMTRPDTLLTGRQARVLITKYMGLSSHVYPGVHFGKRLDLITHGLLGYVYFWEGTFEDMITNIMAFMRVRFPLLRFELSQGKDYFSFTIGCDARLGNLESFYLQATIGSLVSLGSMLTQRMVVYYNPLLFSDSKTLQTLLNCDVIPSTGNNEIRYYTADVQLRTASEQSTPPQPNTSHDRIEEHGFVVRLRSLMLENLKTCAGAEDMASRLGMSVRTLRRRLNELGMNFNAIRTDVRMQIAQRYLTTTSMSIERIADLIGYSDQTTFTRAFREWKGKTPNEIRQQRMVKNSS